MLRFDTYIFKWIKKIGNLSIDDCCKVLNVKNKNSLDNKLYRKASTRGMTLNELINLCNKAEITITLCKKEESGYEHKILINDGCLIVKSLETFECKNTNEEKTALNNLVPIAYTEEEDNSNEN